MFKYYRLNSTCTLDLYGFIICACIYAMRMSVMKTIVRSVQFLLFLKLFYFYELIQKKIMQLL